MRGYETSDVQAIDWRQARQVLSGDNPLKDRRGLRLDFLELALERNEPPVDFEIIEATLRCRMLRRRLCNLITMDVETINAPIIGKVSEKEFRDAMLVFLSSDISLCQL